MKDIKTIIKEQLEEIDIKHAKDAVRYVDYIVGYIRREGIDLSPDRAIGHLLDVKNIIKGKTSY